MNHPPGPIYKRLFGDPQALTPAQQSILDSIPMQDARAAADALAAQPAAESDCEHCGGTGEVLAHAENCLNELCALNGDEHSCAGHVEPCSCAAQPTRAGGDAPFDEDACRERCNVCWGDGSFSTCERKRLHEAAALAAAPQPAAITVPPAWLSDQYSGEFDDMTPGQAFRKGWNDCRAAMLSAPQPAPAEHLSEDIEAMAVARYKVVHAHSSMFWSHAVVAGDGQQQLYIGRELECRNMAAKFAGAFLDGAFVAKQPAPAELHATWGYERQRALMEANRNEAADLWDKGMPMTEQDRRFFRYGFDSGWTRGRAVKSVEQPAPAEPDPPPGSLTIHESLWAEVLRYAETEVPPHPNRLREWSAAIRAMEQPAGGAVPSAVERDACTDSQRLGFVLEHLLGKRDLAALVSIAHDEDGFRLSDDEVLQGIDAAIRGIGSSKEGGAA